MGAADVDAGGPIGDETVIGLGLAAGAQPAKTKTATIAVATRSSAVGMSSPDGTT
jgi:hypothetical protein